MTESLLRMSGISQRFPGVLALDGVDFEVGPGEIHALLGANGAGKSTLLKILSGAQRPESGAIVFAGEEVRAASPRDAQKLGIVTIYQEFTLAPNMSIAENVFIGREPGSKLFVNRRRMASETREIIRRIGLDIDPMTPVRDLSVAEQQMVEIARALSMRSRLVVMDEPTSALSSTEVKKLFRTVRDLKEQGLSIIFVTHRLEEVFEICDCYTVLRDGRRVGSGRVAETNIDGIIRQMVGREVTALFADRRAGKPGAVALEIRGLTRRGNAQDPHASVLADVALTVRRGEILGIAGLLGAGRTELARAVFGADPFDSGQVLVDGKPVNIRSPQDAIRHGIGLVPEDRKRQALFPTLAVRMNLSMAALDRISWAGGFINKRAERAMVDRYRKALRISMASPEQIVINVSGANQQKVVLARWLALRPKVLIVDEPTRGIDVGAKVEVHNLLFAMARSGIAVIVISSDLPEVLAISDRIVTMREGRVTGEILRQAANQEILMTMMTQETALDRVVLSPVNPSRNALAVFDSSRGSLSNTEQSANVRREKLTGMLGSDKRNRRSWTIRKPLGIGLVAVVGLFGLVSLWATTFSISGAVIGKGQVQASANRIAVQHPVGGVVAEILANNGDKVRSGDVVLKLDDSQLRSDLAAVEGELFEILANEARLEAELDDSKELAPHRILQEAVRNDPGLQPLLDHQQRQLDAHDDSLATQVSLLQEQTNQIRNEAVGVQAALDAKREQLAFLENQLASSTKNLAKGIITSTIVTTLQKEVIIAKGEVGSLTAKVAELRGKIAEQQLKVDAIPQDAKEISADRLNLLRQQSTKLIEGRKAILYKLSKLEVDAPVSGMVFDSKILGRRSVIEAAKPIMYIVPDSEPNLIVVRVEAIDIDQVQVGQEAGLRFTTFNRRATPMIFGRVTAVSADAFLDERTRAFYYFVDISVVEEELDKLSDTLISGMPVEAFLTTTSRSPASYVMKPIGDYFAKALRD
jgi:inositol transport system ATP-binding protein